jgi:hypothetical protein
MRPAILILFIIESVPRAEAQVLYLQRLGEPMAEFVAAVGDTVEIEIRTGLQGSPRRALPSI